jgi:DNA invertase Pin-like site-specific DNA recombinase
VTVAAYVRVSTEQQKQEGSDQKQRDRIRQFVDRRDHDAIDWFEDIAVSGQSNDRPAYERLMNSFSEYDAVVVRELSRFGRDPLTVLQDIEKIVDSDTEFVSITEQFDTSSAMGRAFVRIVAVINGMYADLRREQAVRAAERRKEQGKPVGRPRKLSDDQLAEARDLRDSGLSYTNIARLIESDPDGPESVSRETIRRYCVEED